MSGPERRIETILRNKIYSNDYWKMHCFGLTSETILDEAVQLHDIGGTYGVLKKPTKFIMLVMKLLMIRPEREIIYELIMNEEFKYVRALGAFYLRLVGQAAEIYSFIEPLYYDYRPLKYRTDGKSYNVITMDQFAFDLLHSNYYCDVALTRISTRPVLERQGLLKKRVSTIREHFSEEDYIQLMKNIVVYLVRV
ncbi:Pre-mRNA-splicing factor 38 [Entamoeba marina]